MHPENTSPIENQPSIPATPVEPPAQVTPLTQTLANDGNFIAALGAGLTAAIIGGAAWAAITVATNYQIGWMAVGVGFLVGYAVRAAGKGTAQRFAIAGAVLALFGCLLGNLFTVIGVVAEEKHLNFFPILRQLTPFSAVEILQESFQPMDLLFYAIAVYEGFKLSRVRA